MNINNLTETKERMYKFCRNHKNVSRGIAIVLAAMPFICFSCRRNVDMASIRQAIEQQMKSYPKSTLQDIYKNFYQDWFGPGHMIADESSAAAYLSKEIDSYTDISDVYYEPTGSEHNYYRVYLSCVKDHFLSEKMLLDAFIKSANIARSHRAIDWKTYWAGIVKEIEQMDIEIDGFEEDRTAINGMLKQGDMAVHHSKVYNTAYHPHYRIVEKNIFEKELLPHLPVK